MMTFNDIPLVPAGTAVIEPGPVKLRHTLTGLPGLAGGRLASRGVEARPITQAGCLLADTPDALRQQLDTIRQMLDGLPYTLIDQHGGAWPDTVMTELAYEPFVRRGGRWKTDYRIEYLQVIP